MDLARVIFVEDNMDLQKSIEIEINKVFGLNKSFATEFYSDPNQALEAINKNPFNVCLVFLDQQLKISVDQTFLGADFIRPIKKVNSYIEVIMMSADRSEDSLTSWIKNGADKFFYKEKENYTHLHVFIREALTRFNSKFAGLIGSNKTNSIRIPEELKKIGLISVSEEMRGVADLVLQCAKSDLSVFIIGETGTGKELIAKAIHANSDRSDKEFRTIDCTQFKKSEIIASELFGSEKGAFTGAESKMGLLEIANGGTVFLDEVHHLSPEAQAMLLRFLQDRKVRRVGGKTEKQVNVRIVFAAKPVLKELVEQSQFLPDLLYRMKEIKIELPKLTSRSQDLEVLCYHFLDKANEGKPAQKRFHPDSIELLKKYSWPGNVRELENLVKRLAVLVTQPIILPVHIEKFGGLEITLSDLEDIKSRTIEEVQKNHDNEMRSLILKAYRSCDLNFTETARKLGVPRNTLRNQCQSLKIWEIMETSTKKEKTQDRTELKQLFDNSMRRVIAFVEG